MNDNYQVDYNDTDDNLYTDGENKRPKLIIIVVGIVILLIIIAIFFFACSSVSNKSNNNFLNNISVENGELNPKFDKNINDYSVIIDSDFTMVSCSSESSKATTSGCNKRIYITDECVEHIISVTSEDKQLRKYKLNICKQDKNAPIIKDVKLSPTGYSNNKVTITVEVESVNELSDNAYSFDGGLTWQNSNSISVSENKTVEIKVKDIKNNESAIMTKEVTTIDKTIPKVTVKGSVGSNVSTYSNVTLTAIVSPDSTPSGYKYEWYKNNNKINGASSSTYLATSSGTYKVKVITGAGNSTTSSEYKVNKKTSESHNDYKPSITSVVGNPTTWTNLPVTLTVNATSKNGLATKAYSFDGGKTYQASKSKTFNSNQTVKIVVCDKAGNKENYAVEITKIDNVKPKVEITGGTSIGSKLTAKVTPSKTISGYKYQWYLNNVEITGANSLTYTASKSGNYQVKVTTGSKNYATSSNHYIKINIPGSVSLSSSVNSGTWTKNDVTLTAKVSNATATSYDWYANNVKVASTTTNTYVIKNDTNKSYKVVAKFSDGSTATSGTIAVKVDKTAPTKTTVTFTSGGKAYNANGNYWTNQAVDRKFNSTDNGSGIKYFEYSNGCTGNVSGNEGEGKDKYTNYYFEGINVACHRAVDYAGNKGEWSDKNYMKIDRTPPYTPYISKSQNFDYSIQCIADNEDIGLETPTNKIKMCGGSTDSYDLNVLAKDNENGSGIDSCQYVLSEAGGKNYGDIGDFEIVNGQFYGYDTIRWEDGYGPGKNITAPSISYLRRCRDKAGNYSNALVIFWLYIK